MNRSLFGAQRRGRELDTNQPAVATGPGLRRLILRRVPAGPARVAIVSRDGESRIGNVIRQQRPEAKVLDLPLSMDPGERHALLVAQGPYDLVVDHALNHSDRYARLRDLLYLARPGGTMVVRGAGAGAGADSDSTKARRKYSRQLNRLSAAQRNDRQLSNDDAGVSARDLVHLGRALVSMRSRGNNLVLTRSDTPALAKMNESAMNTFLASGAGAPDRVVSLIAGQRFASRCVLRHNAEEAGARQPAEYVAPDISLRLYHQVTVGPGQVVANDRLILPDTYRHNARTRLHNRYVVDLAPRFASLPFETESLPLLAGTYFHLDNEIRGHFGHLMTEQLSRLWAWPQVKAAEPEAKVLMATNKRPEIQEFEYVVLEAAGVAREDVEFLREPARVERMYSATPMLSHPEYVHPAIAHTWLRVGDALAAQAEERARPKRIFCSRRILKRACNNTAEVEDVFRANGFEIVFPEDLPLPEQVQTFRDAEVVAGFAGSGLFNLALVDGPKRVITVGSSRYLGVNEYLIASVLGHEIDQVTCVPDDPRSFQSPFTFDHEREGRWLQTVFASLD